MRYVEINFINFINVYLMSSFVSELLNKSVWLVCQCSCVILGRCLYPQDKEAVPPLGVPINNSSVPFDGCALTRCHEMCISRTMPQSSLTVGVLLKYTGSYKINVDFECEQTMTLCFLAVDYKICSSCVRPGF